MVSVILVMDWESWKHRRLAILEASDVVIDIRNEEKSRTEHNRNTDPQGKKGKVPVARPYLHLYALPSVLCTHNHQATAAQSLNMPFPVAPAMEMSVRMSTRRIQAHDSQ